MSKIGQFVNTALRSYVHSLSLILANSFFTIPRIALNHGWVFVGKSSFLGQSDCGLMHVRFFIAGSNSHCCTSAAACTLWSCDFAIPIISLSVWRLHTGSQAAEALEKARQLQTAVEPPKQIPPATQSSNVMTWWICLAFGSTFLMCTRSIQVLFHVGRFGYQPSKMSSNHLNYSIPRNAFVFSMFDLNIF